MSLIDIILESFLSDENNTQRILQKQKNIVLHITGDGIFTEKNISLILRHLKKIQNIKSFELKFDEHIDLSEGCVKALEDCIQNQRNPCNLALIFGKNCKLGLNGINILIKSYLNLTQLVSLTLEIQRCNFLGFQGAKSIRESLKNLTQLKQFRLQINDQNDIGFEGALEISQGLQCLKNLNLLKLDIHHSNKLTCLGYLSIQKALMQLNVLEVFCLQLQGQLSDVENSIEIEQIIRSIQNVFQMQENLIHLSLVFKLSERLEDTQIKQFLTGIINIKKLKTLELTFDNDQITNQGFVLIGDLLKKQNQLEELKLEFGESNLINIYGQSSLLISLGYLQKLLKLELSSSEFYDSTNAIQSLSLALKHLKQLVSFSLSKETEIYLKNNFSNKFRGRIFVLVKINGGD
ncbi:hypothetical protein TTHERM_00823580 (macronuclear) [Tetrahymena thermophila SB210]|uniref:Kinase domain protein n=1 Tax=Tetrahymena thermophila (strain SB210) TaxID=312017 RepID=I7LZF7_TETTS|nr:hypothetical protein TTHERM_00823580 [Tetrahymena thermophila SB210]EAR83798.1 hypothetical protein TTHERM_00823580 [Tetrahymena thermophila SB210]|eukprot:XP_001031461.1 hypothetical protein TTHERM_00823580 [Tetrahymena thermophila SB210]